MKVLITGAGGFIGAWLIKRLIRKGYRIRVLDLIENRKIIAAIAGSSIADGIEWCCGDIADTAIVHHTAKDCDALIHLAGLLTPACQENPVLGANVNLIGALNIFTAAQKFNIGKVLYMSSAGVFGPDGGSEPHPTTLYGAFKLAAEYSAKAFYETEGISSIGFRPFVVYGPGRTQGLSAGPTLACQAIAQSREYTIPFSGEFDMIHVDDVAAAFEIVLQTSLNGAAVLNLLGTKVSVGEVVADLNHLAGRVAIDAAGDPLPIVAPTEEPFAGHLLPGWRPRSLRQGLQETIEFYRTGIID